LSMRSGRVA